MKPVIIIGYSGHAFVVIDIFKSQGCVIAGYCDQIEKQNNPFEINYFGSESDPLFGEWIEDKDWFVAIGDNKIRNRVFNNLEERGHVNPTSAIHKTAIIGSGVEISDGVMIAANTSVNALASIGQGSIINTGCVIEHECAIGAFTHIAPGAILTGNVRVGDNSFVGAAAVIRQGLTIGKNVMIGAGAVVLHDIPDDSVVVGNPGMIRGNL